MKNKIISVLMLIAGLVLAIVPLNTDCAAHGHFMKNGMVMPCHYTAIALTIIGIVTIVFAFVSFFIKKPIIAIISYIIQFIVSGFGILVLMKVLDIGNGIKPMDGGWKLGLCGKEGMSCITTMKPLSMYFLVGIMVVAIIGIIFNILGKKEN